MTQIAPARPEVSAGARQQLAAVMRASVPGLVGEVTAQIQREVTAYAGAPTGRRRRLIELAVSGAVHHFVLDFEGRAGSGAAVDDHFRRMGRGEAIEGHPLDAMRDAFAIALRDCWGALRRVAEVSGLPASVLGDLGDRLLAYLDHLLEQVAVGHAAGTAALDRDVHRRRDDLAAWLLVTRSPDPLALATYAGGAGWAVPDEVVVVAVDTGRATALPDAAELETDLLARVASPVTGIVVPAARREQAIAEIEQIFDGCRIAYTWVVPVEHAGEAWRWATRALTLARSGTIAGGDRIACDRHLPDLALAADPGLARALADDVLTPLAGLAPYARAVLAETLLAWLPTRPSAPALAESLDVHPQTVRYRMRRIRALFGGRLEDPEASFALLLALRMDDARPDTSSEVRKTA